MLLTPCPVVKPNNPSIIQQKHMNHEDIATDPPQLRDVHTHCIACTGYHRSLDPFAANFLLYTDVNSILVHLKAAILLVQREHEEREVQVLYRDYRVRQVVVAG